ncbi:alpha/beta hydrolase [Azorhizobium doebereinerae]|uniref:alpha/beta hydrolase n=1 Tax=Azorhizobium doebereinerae TaxID=281091 RepID=UPI0004191EC4|nr:alpha/beta hydrolase [Azorhizobium doebereinerae]
MIEPVPCLPDSAEAFGRVRARIAAATSAWAAGMSLAEIRASFEAFLGAGEGAPRVRRTPHRLAGLPACTFDAPGGEAGRTLLYCHGGGFQIGSVRSHAGLMARLAEASGMRVLGFDYRLAPEHRFPAAPDDAFAIYRALAEAGEVPLALVGDSAGGGLALGTVMRARDAGLPLPKALVLLSPWLDLTMGGESYRVLAEKDIFSRPEQLRAMARTYLGRDHMPADPAASPVLGDLSGLPPILVHAGGHDITLDDSHLLADRAAARGSRVEVEVFEGMCHHFQVFEELPEAALSLARIGAFLRAL